MNIRSTLFFFSFSMLVFSVLGQSNISLEGRLRYDGILVNDIWGYATEDNTEYALVGTSHGLSIVSLANPQQPTEVQFIEGPISIWRDIKTFGNYAYVSNETEGGIRIINLSNLPNSIQQKSVVLSGITQVHNLWIDENGVLYLAGLNSNNVNGGLLMADLNDDPWNPQVVGGYFDHYVHDVYVRNDIAYAAQIYTGHLAILDIKDKNAPRLLGLREYENSFTHNTWLNDDGTVCFTTDEVTGAYIYAWDVSDPSNIEFLDRYRSPNGQNTAPHNVHVFNDFLVNSYYKDGVTIVDAARPGNLIQVGNYDTTPQNSGGLVSGEFAGCWGAYPFLPSGLILASELTEGLFVLRPSYTRASYFEGTVQDKNTKIPLKNVSITLLENALQTKSLSNGQFAMGTPENGTFRAAFYAFGYLADTLTVELSNGILTEVTAELEPANTFDLRIKVFDEFSNTPLPNVQIRALPLGSDQDISSTTGEQGEAIFSSFVNGIYEIGTNTWGYLPGILHFDFANSTQELEIGLLQGYYDDFLFDNNWEVEGDAISGNWERGVPNLTLEGVTPFNPGEDAPGDLGDIAYVTGNQGQTSGDDDVDDGETLLISPSMDLSSYGNPSLDFSWWLINYDARLEDRGFQGNDSLSIFVSNGNETRFITSFDDAFGHRWTPSDQYSLKDYISISDDMRILFRISDDEPGNIVEAGIDQFRIFDNFATTQIPLLKEPFHLEGFVTKAERLKGRITIPHVDHVKDMRIETWTLMGQKLQDIPVDRESLTFESYFPTPSGVYMLRLLLNGRPAGTIKIMK